jgi:hypothetical protein
LRAEVFLCRSVSLSKIASRVRAMPVEIAVEIKGLHLQIRGRPEQGPGAQGHNHAISATQTG